jgi:hypothetical protein
VKSIRLASVVLAALIVCGTGIALAAGDATESESASSNQTAPEVELTSKRTATSDTFLLPSGARETRIYESPINYRDAEGNWQPIGDDLEELPDGELSNGPNRFDLRLPEKLGAGPTLLSLDGEWVSAELAAAATEEAQLQGDTASYESPDGGTSFELTGLADGVKENIEIADASQPSSFDFWLDASSGLTPSLAEDGSIVFNDIDGKPLFTLPAPVISDSAPGAQPSADAVHYRLFPEDEGRWKLSVEADRDWLTQPDRVWPARIDPTLHVTSPALDCWIAYNNRQKAKDRAVAAALASDGSMRPTPTKKACSTARFCAST